MSDEPRTSSPGPKVAGQDADDEDHQLTDEEKMLLEIVRLRAMIGALPDDTIDDALNRALHEKKLGQLDFNYQLFIERKRVARELAKFEEKYGVIYSEPCLMCLENIHVHASKNLIKIFICCGGFICTACGRELIGEINKCPLCRESSVGRTVAEADAQRIELAKRGVAWAQAELGTCMIEELKGFKKQKKAGLEWLNKAVAQDHPSAVYNLSKKYLFGVASVLDKSQEKANELLMRSANLGYAAANSLVAKFSVTGTQGFEQDPGEAIFRATVAYALDASDELAATTAGFYLKSEQARELSPYLACYYLNIAANEETNGTACYFYSDALHNLGKHLHNSREIPGYDVVPAAFFWLRKSRDMGYSPALGTLKKWESIGQSYCANCSKDVQPGEKFKQCSKCKAQWYCSKECQVEAWKAGHKKDCKRAAILKFEDYLNAE